MKTPPTPKTPLFAPREQVADTLCVSVTTVDRHVRKELSPVRIAGRVVFDVAEVRAWAAATSSEAARASGREPVSAPIAPPRHPPARSAETFSPLAARILAELTAPSKRGRE